MQLRPQIQIQTVIKAMMEDVLPALDKNDQLAMQSAQLTIGTLALIAQHLPLEYRYDCDELARLLLAARKLADTAGGQQTSAALTDLNEAARVGADVLDRARADPLEIVEAVRRLRAATSDAVQAVFADGSVAAQAIVRHTILSLSKEQLLRDRSWLLMQGWEPDPKSVPTIESLVGPRPRTTNGP